MVFANQRVMNDEHHGSLKQYLNDVIALERDVVNAIEGQLEDARLKDYPDISEILVQMVADGTARIAALKDISDREGGSIGAVLKEGVTAVTGALAGVYGRIREHPVSRMVRDDLVAAHVSATSYGMLLTLALGIGHTETATHAEAYLKASARTVNLLSDRLPLVVIAELAKDAPLTNPAASQLAGEMIRAAWKP